MFPFHMKLRKVGFVVDKVALERVSLRVLQFPSVNIIPPFLHRHFTITETIPVYFIYMGLCIVNLI